MTVTTVYSGTGDGHILSVDFSYAQARAGGTVGFFADTTAVALNVGQNFAAGEGDYYAIALAYLGFDTSGIPDTDTISAAELSLYGAGNSSDTDFTVQARTFNWSGGGLTTADWRTDAQFAALTLLATFNTTGWNTAGYNAFTENGTNLRSSINKTGATYMVVGSSRYASATTPTGAESVDAYSADQAGTTNDPRLVITHAASTTDATVSGVQATVTTDAKAPSITAIRNSTVSGQQAAASAKANVPTVSTTRNPTIAGQAAAASTDAKAPSLSATRNPTVAGETATVAAVANAPAISAGAVVAAAEAIVAAAAQAPTITATRNVSITAAAAAAGADAKAGTVSVVSAGTVAAAVATVATAAAAPVITATRSVTVHAVQAVAIAAAYAVTIGEVIAQAVRRVFMRNSRGIVP